MSIKNKILEAKHVAKVSAHLAKKNEEQKAYKEQTVKMKQLSSQLGEINKENKR